MEERTFSFWLKMLKPLVWYTNLNGLVHIGVLFGFFVVTSILIWIGVAGMLNG